jgi:hypothetical protein
VFHYLCLSVAYVCGSIFCPFTYNKLHSLKLQLDNTCWSSFIMRQTLNWSTNIKS